MPDGTAIVLNSTAEQVFELNETGYAVWRHLQSGVSSHALIELLSGEFDVSPTHIAPDVEELLRELSAAELVSGFPE
jgi:hypothetical protein